ncbi:MAG: AAA family ATPase, partial [Lactobacillales bacterium]|nr:AAA family ATPase [Lactobacillales bacterium]
MLMSLSIQNVVLIDQLDLDFSKDLNVFTGETGAGKSILLDSLSLALGARSDAGLVKHETSHLVVTAQFRVSKKHPLSAVFEEQELPFEEDLILRRIVYKDGRSKAFVNDQAVSVSFLRTVGEMIAEIHGQFAAHRLLDPREHIKALDHFAGLENFKNTVAHAFENWKAHQKKTLEITGDLEKALQEEE